MTSATIRPASGAGAQRVEGRGYGLIIFAAVGPRQKAGRSRREDVDPVTKNVPTSPSTYGS